PPPAQYLVHQSLAASRRHVAASYWTAASDVAATSAPVNAVGQRRSCRRPPVNGGRSRCRRHVAASYWTAASDVAATSAPVNTGQRRSTPPVMPPVNATGHRSTAADHGGDRRSTVAVNDGRQWRTTVDCRWTTVDLHRTIGQRWLVGRSTSGSGSGPNRVGSGSATWHATCQPRVHTCQPCVPTWHPRGS
nr:hypothetical protein [Tanacetum cinerariifolium]